jgi:hypothetical protein
VSLDVDVLFERLVNRFLSVVKVFM